MGINFFQLRLGGDILPVASGTTSLFICPISIQPPSSEEKKAFLTGLRTLYPKSAILATCFPQQPQNPPLPICLPCTITSFYHPKYKKLSPAILLECCKEVFTSDLKITEQESHYLAECTHLQSQSPTWFKHRKGRLTAFKFKAICHTSLTNPSQSLLHRFSNLIPSLKVQLFRGVEIMRIL